MKSIIEIKKGTKIKKELHEGGKVTKLHSEAPGYYGHLLGTIAEDGDPVDVMIFSNDDLDVGDVVDVKIVAIVKVIDEGQRDDKFVGVINYDGNLLEDIKMAEKFFSDYKKSRGENIVIEGIDFF